MVQLHIGDNQLAECLIELGLPLAARKQGKIAYTVTLRPRCLAVPCSHHTHTHYKMLLPIIFTILLALQCACGAIWCMQQLALTVHMWSLHADNGVGNPRPAFQTAKCHIRIACRPQVEQVLLLVQHA